jgi:hypothetical protein
VSDHLRDLIDTYADNADDHEVAADILRTLKVSKRAAEVLFPAVVMYVTTQRRARVRAWERESNIADAGKAMSDTTTTLATPPRFGLHRRAHLLAATFAIGTGERIPWGTATVEQHRQRIGYLLAKRNGLDTTIDRHERAIAAITAAGVSCLADLGDGWEVAA